MTIDEIKQALREMKDRCANTIMCSECPFTVGKRKEKHCPVIDINGDDAAPCDWRLDWPEDGPNENPDATVEKFMNKGREIDYDRMIDAAYAAIMVIKLATHVLGCSIEDISKMDIDKFRPRYTGGFDTERSKHREGEHEDHH